MSTQDTLREQLCSLMIEDDFPILDRSEEEKLDGIIALINSEVQAVLDRVKKDIDLMQPDPDYYAQAIESERKKYE